MYVYVEFGGHSGPGGKQEQAWVVGGVARFRVCIYHLSQGRFEGFQGGITLASNKTEVCSGFRARDADTNSTTSNSYKYHCGSAAAAAAGGPPSGLVPILRFIQVLYGNFSLGPGR